MKDCIGIDFDNIIYKNSKDKDFMKDWVETIWALLPNYDVFLYSKKNPREVEKWFYEEVANGSFPFKVEIVPEKKMWHKPLIVGITDRKLTAVAYIGDTIKFTTWKKVLEEVAKLD